MAKISAKEIAHRKALKELEGITPKTRALTLKQMLEGKDVLCSLIAQCIRQIITFVRDEGPQSDLNEFNQFVATFCHLSYEHLSKQKEIKKADLIPEQALIITTMTVMTNADLLKGILVKLMPKVVRGKLVVDIESDVTHTPIDVTERGIEFYNAIDKLEVSYSLTNDDPHAFFAKYTSYILELVDYIIAKN